MIEIFLIILGVALIVIGLRQQPKKDK